MAAQKQKQDDLGVEVGAQEVAFVQMVRNPDVYPEPHSATVHPDEVANFQLGGWTKQE